MILGRTALPGALTIAYCLCALANALLAITAGADAAHFAEVRAEAAAMPRERTPAATLDDHIPAVGLGKPINRTLWTMIWAVAGLIFQAMGLSYLFGGPIILPQIFRDAIDFVSGPTTFFVGATILFALMLPSAGSSSSGLVAWSAVNPVPALLRSLA